ncbi:Eukaryotic translation initiation factor 3 subunit M [Fusarium oxysporum f. sp. albedinis]|nr:Eukaryotic translation initiation factor 3 subunit M [Fusarium oxysporum f. sp. albedinis]
MRTDSHSLIGPVKSQSVSSNTITKYYSDYGTDAKGPSIQTIWRVHATKVLALGLVARTRLPAPGEGSS